MLVTLSGIVTLVRPHSLNALLPMLVTLFGIVMLVRSLQSLNALVPMLVTLSGMFMLVRPPQPLNALLPMLVTLSLVGITLFLQPNIKVLLFVSIKQLPSL